MYAPKGFQHRWTLLGMLMCVVWLLCLGWGSSVEFRDNIGASTNTTTQGGGALYTSGGTTNFFR